MVKSKASKRSAKSNRSNASQCEEIVQCPHLHFKSDVIDRNVLSKEQHLNLLSTPKGYRWEEEADDKEGGRGEGTENLPTNVPRRVVCTGRRMRKPEKVYVHNFLAEVWTFLTPEMIDRLKGMLMNEFGMSPQEADQLVNEQRESNIVKSSTVSLYKKPRKLKDGSVVHDSIVKLRSPNKSYCDKYPKSSIGIRNSWIRNFSDMLSEKISSYVLDTMCAERTERQQEIAQTLLTRFNTVLEQKASMTNPKTKTHKAMVLVADKLSLWLDKNVKVSKETAQRLKELEEEEENKRLDDERKKKDEEKRKLEVEKKKKADEERRLAEEKLKAAEEAQKEQQPTTDDQQPPIAGETRQEPVEPEKTTDQDQIDSAESPKTTEEGEPEKPPSEGQPTEDKEPKDETQPEPAEQKLESDEQKPETDEQKPETDEQKPETDEQKPETDEQKPETEGAAEPAEAEQKTDQEDQPDEQKTPESAEQPPTETGEEEPPEPSEEPKPETGEEKQPEAEETAKAEDAEQKGEPQELPPESTAPDDAGEKTEPVQPPPESIEPSEDQGGESEKPLEEAESPKTDEEAEIPPEATESEAPDTDETKREPSLPGSPKPGETPGETPIESGAESADERVTESEDETKPGEKEPEKGEPGEGSMVPFEEETVPGEEPTDKSPSPLQDIIQSVASMITEQEEQSSPRQEAIKDVIEKELEKKLGDEEQEAISEVASKVGTWMDKIVDQVEEEYADKGVPGSPVAQRAKGPVFKLRKMESAYDVELISNTKAEQKIREARGKPSPNKTVDQDAPLESADLKEWAKWASAVTDMAQNWAEWIEDTVQEAQKKGDDYKNNEVGDKMMKDWEQFKDKKSTDAVEWRRTKKQVDQQAEAWRKKTEKDKLTSPKSQKDKGVVNVEN